MSQLSTSICLKCRDKLSSPLWRISLLPSNMLLWLMTNERYGVKDSFGKAVISQGEDVTPHLESNTLMVAL